MVLNVKPKRIHAEWGKLKEIFKLLGEEQAVRTGGAESWSIGAIMAEMRDSGFQEHRGGVPWGIEGEGSPRDGNRRLTAAFLLAQENPDVFGKLKIPVDVYPSTMTEPERDELMAASIRSTKPMTRKDYDRYIMHIAQTHPSAGQRGVAEIAGLELIQDVFSGAFKQGALEKDPKTGRLRFKEGLKEKDVWANKQGAVQVGIALAKAHPEVVRLYFNQEPGKYLTYKEVIDANAHWEADKEARPDVASCQTFNEIAKKFPESALVGFAGPIATEGRQTATASRTPGDAAKLDTKTRKALAQTLSKCEPFLLLLNLVDGKPGYSSATSIDDLTKLGSMIQDSLTPESKEIVAKINARGVAAAKALSAKIEEGEKAKADEEKAAKKAGKKAAAAK